MILSFRTDNGGEAIRINDAKISFGNGSTWATRLAQIKSIRGYIYISTFSLPDLSCAQKILAKRPHDIYIVAHSRFNSKALDIKHAFPDIRIALRDDIHAKFVLIEPKTVWLSSANFGKSGWFEHTIGFHSKYAFTFYKNAFCSMLEGSNEVCDRREHEDEQNISASLIKPCPFCGGLISESNIIQHNITFTLPALAARTAGYLALSNAPLLYGTLAMTFSCQRKNERN